MLPTQDTTWPPGNPPRPEQCKLAAGLQVAHLLDFWDLHWAPSLPAAAGQSSLPETGFPQGSSFQPKPTPRCWLGYFPWGCVDPAPWWRKRAVPGGGLVDGAGWEATVGQRVCVSTHWQRRRAYWVGQTVEKVCPRYRMHFQRCSSLLRRLYTVKRSMIPTK